MADKLDKPKLVSSGVMSFPQPPLRNAEEYLKAYTGYVHTAVSSIAQEVASIDLHLFKTKYIKGEPEINELREHEILSLLNYVNPLTTFYDLIESTQIYLELTGESFWIVLKEGKEPKEIWLVRPDWMKVKPSSKDVVDSYIYHPGGHFNEQVKIPKENVIHFKYFNPLNPYRGKGSVQAAALPLDTHTFAQEYNRNFFFNSAVPSVVFTTDKQIQEATIKRFINQWQATYGGRAKSNKVAFLGNGLKMDKISIGGKEMDFAKQQEMMRDDILAVFKVPRTILGLTDDVNRANAEATTSTFMERVVTPKMRKLVNTLNEFLIPMYNDNTLFLDFTDPAPEDVESKLKYYENALQNGWMTPNEVRKEENKEAIPGGDVPLPYLLNPIIPRPEEYQEEPMEEEVEEEEVEEEGEEEKSSLFEKISRLVKKDSVEKTKKKVVEKVVVEDKKEVPFKHMVKPPVKSIDKINREKLQGKLTKAITEVIGDLLEKKDVKRIGINEEIKSKNDKKQVLFTEEGKTAYWKKFVDDVTNRELELRNVTVDAFEEQEKMVLDLLENSVKYWKKDVRKGKESSAIPSKSAFLKVWLAYFVETIKDIYVEQGTNVLEFLGVGGTIDTNTDSASQYLQEDTTTLIKGIDETTRQKLVKTLKEGFGNEEGVNELRKRVKDVFKEATTSRAEMIARTEALRASNGATVEAYRQSGVVEAKEWLAERDDRTCSFCQEMDGKVVGLDKNYFNKGDVVSVGDEELKLDHLDVGQPPLHPRCRCTTIPVLIGD